MSATATGRPPWHGVFHDPVLRPWLEVLLDALEGTELFDAHAHTGCNDPDGFKLSAEELIAGVKRAGARAMVTPMHEPDGYPPHNDRVIAEAAASDGLLVPFCRLDPNSDPVAEARRCLDAGAKGIKLHPRAEGFSMGDPAVAEIVTLAHERSLPVLIHAGRGIPALGAHTVELAQRFPQARMILAHAGICDLAWIWRPALDTPNLFFDTAWWSPSDQLALFAQVPPGQILLGTDPPYGTTTLGAIMALRSALAVGLSPEQIAVIAGGQFVRLIAGEQPLDLGPPPGVAGLAVWDIALDRVYTFLITALGRMMLAMDGSEPLALARLACAVGDDAPQAHVCASINRLLDLREQLLAQAGAADPRLGLGLVVIAANIARTPSAPLPELAGEHATAGPQRPPASD
ncbi:MAG TPA: amidohydrolase family protein [Solirubrobacteraceae bacterium]|nr:amidohydrolase family protein [Solirubrobacteraceae bacterium]